MIKFLLFLVLWFVDGILIFLVLKWYVVTGFIMGLYFGWYWLGMTGQVIYNAKIAMVAFKKWSGKDIHEEESLVKKLEELWKRLNALVVGNTR